MVDGNVTSVRKSHNASFCDAAYMNGYFWLKECMLQGLKTKQLLNFCVVQDLFCVLWYYRMERLVFRHKVKALQLFTIY